MPLIGLGIDIWVTDSTASHTRPPPTSPTNLQLRDTSIVQDRANNNIQTVN